MEDNQGSDDIDIVVYVFCVLEFATVEVFQFNNRGVLILTGNILFGLNKYK